MSEAGQETRCRFRRGHPSHRPSSAVEKRGYVRKLLCILEAAVNEEFKVKIVPTENKTFNILKRTEIEAEELMGFLHFVSCAGIQTSRDHLIGITIQGLDTPRLDSFIHRLHTTLLCFSLLEMKKSVH